MDATAMSGEIARPAKRPRGFATMTPERLKAISRKGGKTAHARGKAHQFNTEEGRIAGRKGGLARAAKARAA